MRPMLKLAAYAAALALAACGPERGADDLTAEERDKLDSHAKNLDGGGPDVVDASPDSLVANEEWTAAETGEAAAAENASAAGNAAGNQR